MATPGTTSTKPHPVWSALVGLTSLGILLQGLWAGLFLRRGDQKGWVSVHEIGGSTISVLALLATVAAVVWLRDRRDLLIGTVLLLVLVLAEVMLGYSIKDSANAVVVHVPLALALIGLAVWLPLAARRR